MNRTVKVAILVLVVLVPAGFMSGVFTPGTDANNQPIPEDVVEKQPVKLGYCPTMSGIALRIGQENPQVSLIPYDSTARALQSLNDRTLNVILVGRLAKENEVGEVFERRLIDGLTLVGKEKRFISIDEMQRSRIHTYTTKKEAREYLPNTEVIFHDSFEFAIKEGIDEIILMPWRDIPDYLELVIPVDENMNKIEKFRVPVLYSYDVECIKNIKV